MNGEQKYRVCHKMSKLLAGMKNNMDKIAWDT